MQQRSRLLNANIEDDEDISDDDEEDDEDDADMDEVHQYKHHEDGKDLIHTAMAAAAAAAAVISTPSTSIGYSTILDSSAIRNRNINISNNGIHAVGDYDHHSFVVDGAHSVYPSNVSEATQPSSLSGQTPSKMMDIKNGHPNHHRLQVSANSNNSNNNHNNNEKDVDVTGSMLSQMNQGGFHATFHGRFGKRYQRNNKRGKLKNLRCFPECGTTHKERGFCGRPLFITLSCPKDTDLKLPICWAEFVPCEMKPNIVPGSKIMMKDLLINERTKDFPLNPYLRGKIILDVDKLPVIQNFKYDQHHIRDFIVGFNLELRGWHYSWVSNKHSCDSLHTLQVYIFHPSNSSSTTSSSSSSNDNLGNDLINHMNSADTIAKQMVIDTIDEIVLPSLNGTTDVESKRTKVEMKLNDVELECDAVFRSPIFRVFCRRRRRFILEPTAPIAPIKQKSHATTTSSSIHVANDGNNLIPESSKKARKPKMIKPLAPHSSSKKNKIPASPLKTTSVNDMISPIKSEIDVKANLFSKLDDSAKPQNNLWVLSAALDKTETKIGDTSTMETAANGLAAPATTAILSSSIAAAELMNGMEEEPRQKNSRARSEQSSSNSYTPPESPKAKKANDQQTSTSSSVTQEDENASAFLLLKLSAGIGLYPPKIENGKNSNGYQHENN